MKFIGGNTSLIGLDIGNRVVKAAQLQRTRNAWRARAIAVLPRRVDEPLEQTASQIAHVLDRQGFSGRTVVLSAPVLKIQCDMLDLPPRSSGAPIEQIAKLELGRAAKLDPTRFEMGCWDVPAPIRSTGSSMIALALRHEDADAMIDPLEKCGLEVTAIDAHCWALHRACRKLFAPERACAILDLGWSTASLHIADRQTVLYQRTLWDAGIDSLHRIIVKEHGLSDDAAELMLRAEEKDCCDLATAGRALSLIRPFVKQLCDELHTSLAFARQRFPGTLGDQLLLTGGGATLPGVTSLLSDRLGLKVSMVTAGQLVDLGDRSNVESHLPLLAAAVGLALYGEQDA